MGTLRPDGTVRKRNVQARTRQRVHFGKHQPARVRAGTDCARSFRGRCGVLCSGAAAYRSGDGRLRLLRRARCPGSGAFADSDGDGLYDGDETGVYGTNPYVYDTDGDGTGDGTEVYYGSDPRTAGGSAGTAGLDSDGDGLFDTDETQVYGTNPYVYDSDGDGVGDGQEVYNGTNPAG